MTKWLTTGEMIDRLKVGEIAEGNVEDYVCYVKKSTLGAYYQVEEPENDIMHPESKRFKLISGVNSLKWRILPNYVSFDEAMKALKEGFIVKLHHEEYDGEFVFNINTKTGFNVSLKFEEFYNGKWTIEGDCVETRN